MKVFTCIVRNQQMLSKLIYRAFSVFFDMSSQVCETPCPLSRVEIHFDRRKFGVFFQLVGMGLLNLEKDTKESILLLFKLKVPNKFPKAQKTAE